MPRLRKYSENELLDKSMELFWAKGYLGTSLKDLETTLNLKAPSIYHAFGSKEALFLRVIEHYLQEVVDKRIQTYLKKDANPIQNITAFFESLIEPCHSISSTNGCLLTNTATELGSTNQKASALVQVGLDKIEEAIYFELAQAKKNKQLASEIYIEDTTATLVLGYQGLLVILRLGYKIGDVEKYVASLLKALDSTE